MCSFVSFQIQTKFQKVLSLPTSDTGKIIKWNILLFWCNTTKRTIAVISPLYLVLSIYKCNLDIQALFAFGYQFFLILKFLLSWLFYAIYRPYDNRQQTINNNIILLQSWVIYRPYYNSQQTINNNVILLQSWVQTMCVSLWLKSPHLCSLLVFSLPLERWDRCRA